MADKIYCWLQANDLSNRRSEVQKTSLQLPVQTSPLYMFRPYVCHFDNSSKSNSNEDVCTGGNKDIHKG